MYISGDCASLLRSVIRLFFFKMKLQGWLVTCVNIWFCLTLLLHLCCEKGSHLEDWVYGSVSKPETVNESRIR